MIGSRNGPDLRVQPEYELAFLMACAAVALHTALTSVSDAQASGGMDAFGDLVLLTAVFGVAALVPTGAALWFVWSRKRRRAVSR